ncbi:MAG: hypothetical protein IT342_12145 [Candidatus Melainabacteria bacterium]|nr:hypothetical protein [Candidatus Melainabacteria bacterium]
MDFNKRGQISRAAGLSLASIASFLITTGCPVSTWAAPEAKASSTNASKPSDPFAALTPSAPAAPVVSPALQSVLAAYSQSPDQAGFDRMIAVMKDVLVQPPLRDLDAAAIIKNHPQLADLGARAFDAGGAKVWAFNRCPFAQTVIIISGHGPGPAAAGKPPAFPAAYRAQLLSMPPSISVSAAKIVTKSAPAPVKVVTVGRGKAIKRVAAPLHAPVAAPGAPKFLVITGSDRATGLITLYGLKPSDAGWMAAPELFTSVPPFLLSSVQGRASFSGPDIVLSLTSAKSPADKPAAAPNGKAVSQPSSGYKIVLRFVNSKYLLEGKAPDEGPAMVVHQFLQAVKDGRQDVAKAWLANDHLASIPKYLGLYGKTDQAYKLVAMSNPMGGGSRFRVVTFGKDDLILDVGLIKKFDYGKPRSYVAIKSLFVAPPDPFAKKLVGVTANFERIGDPAPSPDTASNKSESKQ